MTREIIKGNNYQDRLIKLIPGEIIAAYMVISGIIPDNIKKWGLLIVAGILLIIIPFYLWRILNIKNKFQIIAISISFLIWCYSLHGTLFKAWKIYQGWIASVLLVLWTLVLPIFVVSKEDKKEEVKEKEKPEEKKKRK